jgi:hypothetical protein
VEELLVDVVTAERPQAVELCPDQVGDDAKTVQPSMIRIAGVVGDDMFGRFMLALACASGTLSTRSAGGTAGWPSLEEARAARAQAGQKPPVRNSAG